jgi:Tol biopolymer transport system component
MSAPKVSNVKRRNGVAGQYQVSASVQYEGEQASTITFVGYGYGSRTVVMITPDGHQIVVSSRVIDRIGADLNAAWVRAFFAGSGGEL